MISGTPPTRPATGRQARAEATRSRIVDETVACILEEGYAAASAKHITERAGVTWGVVQYHFGDRNGILTAVTHAGLQEFMRVMESIELPEGPVRARLETILDEGYRAFTNPVSLASYEILVATRGSPEDILQGQGIPFATEMARLGAMLAPGNDRTVGRVLFNGLRGMVLNRLVVRDDVDSSRDRQALIDVVLAYLESTGNGTTVTDD